MFPSQERALRKAFKKADKFDHFRQRTRRQFVALGRKCRDLAPRATIRRGRSVTRA
jgi:hypothetical protein